MADLNPCYFCGSENVAPTYISSRLKGPVAVGCGQCGALGPPCGAAKEAERRWNAAPEIMATTRIKAELREPPPPPDHAVVGICGPTVDELADDVAESASAAAVVYCRPDGTICTAWTQMTNADLALALMVLDRDIRALALASEEVSR